MIEIKNPYLMFIGDVPDRWPQRRLTVWRIGAAIGVWDNLASKAARQTLACRI